VNLRGHILIWHTPAGRTYATRPTQYPACPEWVYLVLTARKRG
jgi:hypothetical protein